MMWMVVVTRAVVWFQGLMIIGGGEGGEEALQMRCQMVAMFPFLLIWRILFDRLHAFI